MTYFSVFRWTPASGSDPIQREAARTRVRSAPFLWTRRPHPSAASPPSPERSAMPERPKSRTVQLSDLLERIERIETRLQARGKKPYDSPDDDTAEEGDGDVLKY